MKSQLVIDLSSSPVLIESFLVIEKALKQTNYGFITLLRDTSYEFKRPKCSSRMLNHYQAQGWVIADRLVPNGKRRFSLIGMTYLNLNIEHGGIASKYALQRPDTYLVSLGWLYQEKTISGSDMTPLELMTILALTLYGSCSIGLNMNGENAISIVREGMPQVDVTTSLIRCLELLSTFTFRKDDGHAIKNEADFIVQLLRYLDRIRLTLGTWVLNPKVYKAMGNRQFNVIDSNDRQYASEGPWFSLGEHLRLIESSNERLVVDIHGDVYTTNAKWLGRQEFVRLAFPVANLMKLSDVFKRPEGIYKPTNVID